MQGIFIDFGSSETADLCKWLLVRAFSRKFPKLRSREFRPPNFEVSREIRSALQGFFRRTGKRMNRGARLSAKSRLLACESHGADI
jgi:hypothetical protein